MRFTILILCTALLLPAQQQPPAQSNAFPSADEFNRALPQWLRFNMKVQPASWLKFQFQGQDARVFWRNQNPAAPPYQNTMDLRLAYVEIGETEKGTFGLRVGRQELVFGDQRLVGHVSW